MDLYNICTLIFYIGCPILMVWLVPKIPVIRKLGPLCVLFILGMVYGNLFPPPATHGAVKGFFATNLMNAALPLMLVSSNVVDWAKRAGVKMIKAFGCHLLSSAIYPLIMLIFLAKAIPDGWIMGGGLTAISLGATLNYNAVCNSLGFDPAVLSFSILVIIVTCVPHVAFLSSGKNIVGKFLHVEEVQDDNRGLSAEEMEDIDGCSWEVYVRLVKSWAKKPVEFVKLLVMVGIAFGTFYFFKWLAPFCPAAIQSVVTIIGCSLAGIIYSFIKPLNKIRGTFQVGMLMVYMMAPALTIGADLRLMTGELLASVGVLAALTFFIQPALYYLFCKFAKVDRDTAMVVDAGCTHSPGYVAPVAGHLGNRGSLISGIGGGILGYAFGNFIGIGMAYFLRFLFY